VPSDEALEPVRWGILGASRFALRTTIPAMQRGQLCRLVALASRSIDKAQQAAAQMGIPRAYGSYSELVADADVEAVYIPLPNHLHVEWAIQAAEAGKHVLCEKPIALNVAQTQALLAVQRRTKVCIAEAYMVCHHPQWEKVMEIVHSGRVGKVRAVQTAFSYSNADPMNIRNQKELGGGATYDIGGYAIYTARLILGAEPLRAAAVSEFDPQSGCDRLTSALLDFGHAQASFVVGTQHVPYQRVQIFGTAGHLEVEIPFNAPNSEPCRLYLNGGRVMSANDSSGLAELVEVPVADQYTIQGDAFARAVRTGHTPRNDIAAALANMQAMEAVLRAAQSGAWEAVGSS
jgi:predicted dehydrogenase